MQTKRFTVCVLRNKLFYYYYYYYYVKGNICSTSRFLFLQGGKLWNECYVPSSAYTYDKVMFGKRWKWPEVKCENNGWNRVRAGFACINTYILTRCAIHRSAFYRRPQNTNPTRMTHVTKTSIKRHKNERRTHATNAVGLTSVVEHFGASKHVCDIKWGRKNTQYTHDPAIPRAYKTGQTIQSTMTTSS